MSRNIMTCDLEDWFHTTVVQADRSEWDLYEHRVVDSTQRVLEMLDKNQVKITFFVLGYVAEKYPDLIKTVADAGHEIATHSQTHPLIYDLQPHQFEAELAQSVRILSEISGQPVRGFRAPSWSLRRDMQWAFELMHAQGIQYDSSLFPFKTYLYGDNTYSRFGYEIPLESGGRLFELPPSVAQLLNRRVPFCGGFYMRVLPYWAIRRLLNAFCQENHPGVIYFHPWEVDENQPRVKLKAMDSIIQYYNLASMEAKLTKLTREFEFMPMGQYLRETGAIPAEPAHQETTIGN